MVKITPSPIKEIVVHENIMVPMEDLLRSRITPGGTFPLYWCGGVLFTFNSMPWSRQIIQEYLEGRVHWIEVQYTRMDSYKPVLELNDPNYGAGPGHKIRVIDTSASVLHTDVAKWLKAKM